MPKVSLTKAAGILLEQSDILILCHRFPDGDTLGSAFALCRALRSLGKRCNVMCGDIIPAKFEYLTAGLEPDDLKREFIAAVDVADTGLLGLLEEDYGKKVGLCIDHHSSNTLYAANTYVDGRASAVGEIIFNLIPKLGAQYTREICDALYTAICTDTGCFKYTNVTPATFRIAAKLLDLGADAHTINRVMFDTKTRSRMAIERMMLETLVFRMDGRIAIMTLTEKMMSEAGANEGDTDGLSAIPRTIEGVDIGIMLREVKDGCKISVRTTPGANACEICKRFGGGGHAAAAGCTIKTDDIGIARDMIADAAEEALGDRQ